MTRILIASLALALSAPAGAAGEPARGGSVTFLSAGDIDYLDPGLTYYTFGYAVQFAVNRSLYGHRPGDLVPVPDLAAGPPEIAPDKRTVTVRIRPGVRYAPPVNREVRADDIRYAFERSFTTSVPSGYATTYFRDIVGAPRHPQRTVSLPGIETPDDRTLVFRLRRPVAETFAAALVMPITVPVPREVATPLDRRRYSRYDEAVAFTGPYTVTRRDPGFAIELERNPNWDPAADFRPAYLDSIRIEEGNVNLTKASRRALGGSGLLCCDAGQPPLPVLRSALRERSAQVHRVAGGGTRWIALNTRIRPFDDVNVRRAVVAGMNRTALRATRGGALIGPIAQHYVPPGLPGFDESGGAAGFTDLDFLAKPTGSRALFRAYLRKAKRRIPRRRLLMVGTNADPGRRTALTAARQLRRLGFRIRLRLVPQETLYTRFCGVPRSRYAICANVGWFKDYHDPESLLAPTFKGAEIRRQGNINWSQLRVPLIDRAMNDAALVPAGPDRWRAWAQVNHAISARAPGVPYVWDDSISVSSADVETAVNPYHTVPDLSFTGRRG